MVKRTFLCNCDNESVRNK